MDVIEIDAATNTQIDKVRDVIIAGLGVRPARDRYKIFIIDEVHRLSPQSFDALLKSVEEPPPHVVFMMATTELEKVPVTIQSRSQVFELKTIGLAQIAAQLRRIADAEGIQIDDAAVQLVARAGDGSMRDAQSALDQVLAFAGETITAEDVATVLGLVRRDVLLDIAEVVAAEDAAAAFAFAGQRGRGRLRPQARRPRAGAADARPAGRPDRPVARRRSRDRRRGGARSAGRARETLLARGPDARLRRAVEGGVRDPRVRAARAITSRWRCCGGSTCGSSCRSAT
jgi:hypothetical protein